MIIFGWGRTTTKLYGTIADNRCGNCSNSVQRSLIKVTTWFTLFFIPIIPYRTQYLSVCPICGAALQLSKEEFMELAENPVASNPGGIGEPEHSPAPGAPAAAVSDSQKYAGKNETQINFLKQMEEARSAKES